MELLIIFSFLFGKYLRILYYKGVIKKIKHEHRINLSKMWFPIDDFTELRDEAYFSRLKCVCPKCGAKYRISFNKDFVVHPIYKDVSSGYDDDGYDEDGYDKDGIDYNGFDRNHIHKDTKTLYDNDGYDFEGYNKDGYSSMGVSRNGDNFQDEDEYDADGYDKNGYDKDGYDRNGYDVFGYDKKRKR